MTDHLIEEPGGSFAASGPAGRGIEAGGATPPASPAPDGGAARGRSVWPMLERDALVGLLAVVVIVMSLAKPDLYPTAANFRATMASQAVLAVCALAALVPLVAGQFDLSSGAVLGASAVGAASALGRGVPLPLALLGAVGIGATVGVTNGLLVTRLSINPLIVTLGTASVVRGLLDRYVGGKVLLEGIPTSLTRYGSALPENLWIGLPRVVFLMALTACAVWYLVEHTPFGRSLAAVGASPAAARLVGVRVERRTIAAFTLGGALAGVAGVLQLAYSGQGNPAVGPNFTLPALAAVFLGASAIRPGRTNVGGTIVAIYFLAATISGLNFLGLGRGVEPLFNGFALLTGVGLSSVLARRRR
ncbi:MAG: ABC transporter permease [Ilumatobacteraceae bacterium]